MIGDDAWVIEFCDNTFLNDPLAVIDGPAPIAYDGSMVPAPQGMYCYAFNIGFSLSGVPVDLSIVAENNEIAECTFTPPPG